MYWDCTVYNVHCIYTMYQRWIDIENRPKMNEHRCSGTYQYYKRVQRRRLFPKAELFLQKVYFQYQRGFIEDQAFSPLCDLAPPSPHYPPSREKIVSLSQSSRVSPTELTDGRRGRGWERRGEETYHTTARTPGILKLKYMEFCIVLICVIHIYSVCSFPYISLVTNPCINNMSYMHSLKSGVMLVHNCNLNISHQT